MSTGREHRSGGPAPVLLGPSAPSLPSTGLLFDLCVTVGTWVGLVKDITQATEERRLKLEPGDTLVLYTDGLSEARSSTGMMFDLKGMEKVLADGGTPEEVRDRLVGAARAHMKVQDDDMTLLIVQWDLAA
nr:SpoIIE family protein phosphatase [Corallococcus exercitus]